MYHYLKSYSYVEKPICIFCKVFKFKSYNIDLNPIQVSDAEVDQLIKNRSRLNYLFVSSNFGERKNAWRYVSCYKCFC